MTTAATKAAILKRLNLEDMSVCGYWFCTTCSHITEVNNEGIQTVCIMCHRPTVKFNPPTLLPDPKPTPNNRT